VKSIVILISGRGSNLAAIIEAARRESWPARIVAVISSRRTAPGVALAEAAGLPVEILDQADFAERGGQDQALADALARHAPDLVVLAGFMRILPDALVRAFEGRMLNIHPSLLPAFKGLHTHRQALEAGVRVHGATVNFVTPELDHGPIVAQALVPVLPADTAALLEARVLAQEHRLYPRVLRWMLEDRVTLTGGIVRVDASDHDLVLGWPGTLALA
jgi:phosphoribosylglycinamide formyltransferase-1